MSGLNSLNLTDEEVALFSAIIILQSGNLQLMIMLFINYFQLFSSCFTSTDRPQIYDVKAINKIQETIIAALKFQINKHRENEGSQTTFQKLIMKLNELRAIGSSHSLHLQWFRTNWSRLKLPPLFAEIFDIPKMSSFSQQQQQHHHSQQLQPINTTTTTTTLNNDDDNDTIMISNTSLTHQQQQPIITLNNQISSPPSSSSTSQIQIQPATTTQTIIKTEPFEQQQQQQVQMIGTPSSLSSNNVVVVVDQQQQQQQTTSMRIKLED